MVRQVIWAKNTVGIERIKYDIEPNKAVWLSDDETSDWVKVKQELSEINKVLSQIKAVVEANWFI